VAGNGDYMMVANEMAWQKEKAEVVGVSSTFYNSLKSTSWNMHVLDLFFNNV